MTLDTPISAKPKPARNRFTPRREAPLPADVQRVVARFPKPARAAIRVMIRTVPQAADLAQTFPGLLYALASGSSNGIPQTQALALLSDGAPLKSVAKAAGVPMWLRRLPPQAFGGDLAGLPDSDGFARRIAARLPARNIDAEGWLQSVRFAATAADEDFALWVARHRVLWRAAGCQSRLAVLALYAWHSRHATDGAGELVWSRWRPEMSLETAICAGKSWFNRIVLSLYLPAGGKIDPWLEPAEVEGISFVPMVTAEDLLTESRSMNNCADQYALSLARNRSRLFSLQRGEARLATVEIGAHPRERNVLVITQLKGYCNTPVPLDVWHACYRWLATQSRLLDLDELRSAEPRHPDTAAFERLIGAYRAARPAADVLPAHIDERTLERLDSALAELARDCGVRSWLFV